MSTSLRPGLAHSQFRADGARCADAPTESRGRLAARQVGGWLGPACSCGLSSVCACSGPCLLHVPVLCVLGLCAFVLVVWCACIAFVYIVRPSPVNVVDITAVRGVLVRFVVGVRVLRPLPAARARAVCPRSVRAATARCDLCW